MESAFGHSFSQVRVHNDTRAADLSSSLNARAFTIGSDVAFGTGEYRPGTPVGDALLAHELAHVVQQSAGARPGSVPQKQGEEYGALEEEADLSAVRAVAAIWGGRGAGLLDKTTYSGPHLRSGLRLSRCSSSPTVDRINLVNSAAGAIGGFPAITSADLNSPGPFNNPSNNAVNHALQVHFHLDAGKSDALTPRREIQRTATAGGTTSLNPPDQPAPGGVGPPTPGGFGGVLVGDDGPPEHEIQRPSDDALVVADAPGYPGLPATAFPVTYRAHCKVIAATSAGSDVAMIRYDVLIDKRTATEVPNTENRSVVVEKRDIARGRAL